MYLIQRCRKSASGPKANGFPYYFRFKLHFLWNFLRWLFLLVFLVDFFLSLVIRRLKKKEQKASGCIIINLIGCSGAIMNLWKREKKTHTQTQEVEWIDQMASKSVLFTHSFSRCRSSRSLKCCCSRWHPVNSGQMAITVDIVENLCN